MLWGSNWTPQFKFSAYNTHLQFSNPLYCDKIGYDKVVGNTKIYFYNPYVDGGYFTGWWWISSNGSITITRFFKTNNLIFTVTAPSGNLSVTQIYVGEYGKPSTVTGATSYSYDSTSKVLTIRVLHHSTATVNVGWGSTTYVGGPEHYTWNPYQALTTYLRSGNLIGFVTSAYTNLMGEVFWAVIVLVISVPIYMKTGSLVYVSVMWLLLGSILGAMLPPEASHIAWILIGLGVSVIFYKLVEASRK